MALSTPRTVFGIHAITPYNRTTGEFYGTSRVLSGSTFSLTGETIDLFGGSSKYSWQTEDGTINAELSFTMKEYPDWAMQLFLGKDPTNVAAEASGNCSTLTDKYGTVVNATTGIASVSVETDEEDELKFGKYVVKVVSGTTVDVYMSSNIDHARGTDGSFQDDLLKITASPITIPDSGATVSLTGYGVEFTGGSGTVNLETAGAVGDTATFEVRPINTGGATTATFGLNADTYPEFGCLVYAQQQGSGRMFEIDILRVKSIGLPLGMTANEFSEAEITAKASYDSTEDAVFKIREVIV